jgi:uncharacterized protein YfiM (DUF2279 family)
MKKLILVFFVLSTKLFCQSTLDKVDDKTLHFYAGATLSMVGAEVANQIIDRPALSALIGAAFAASIGYAKEALYDRYLKHGVYSVQDMLMTGWGGLCGAIAIRVVFDIKEKKRYNEQKQANKIINFNLING